MNKIISAILLGLIFGLSAKVVIASDKVDCSSCLTSTFDRYKSYWYYKTEATNESLGVVFCYDQDNDGKCDDYTAYPNGEPGWLGTTDYEAFYSIGSAIEYLKKRNCQQ